MPLKRFRSPPPKSPFGPDWDVPLWIDELKDPDTLAAIRDLVLSREQEVKSGIAPHPIAGISDGMTNRWQGFNIFGWPEPEVRALHDFVHASYLEYLEILGLQRRRCYIQGWANVVRQGEKFAPHTHDQSPYAYISGNFTVACEGTETIYHPPYLYQGSPNKRASMAIENEPGMLTLFPSTLYHETSAHPGESERVSLAFDIFLQDQDLSGRIGGQGLHILFDFPQEEFA